MGQLNNTVGLKTTLNTEQHCVASYQVIKFLKISSLPLLYVVGGFILMSKRILPYPYARIIFITIFSHIND